MTPHLRLAGLLLASLAVMPVLSSAARAQPPAASSSPRKMSAAKQHRVVIQVSENDPKVMNLALNNAENLTKFYEQAGEIVHIEIVAYGPGLNMVRSDTSPVKDRVAALVGRPQNISFSGCSNTLSNQSKQEGKEITLLPQAKMVPTGIARIVELQEQGWTYVRP
jgi:intracellular sulfur oxidation DsrE/DsrF family protein